MDPSAAAGAAPPPPNYDNLTLEELLQSRDWKARQTGWNRLSVELQNPLSHFLDYLENNVRNAPLEPNAAALDSALQTLQSFITYCPDKSILTKLRSYVLTPLAEKGLSSMRAGTKKASMSILLDLYGFEDGPDTLITELLSLASTHKQPKVAANTLIGLNECIKAFGLNSSSSSEIQAFLASKNLIVNLFSHADKNVRLEVGNFIIQISSSLSIKTLPPFLQHALSSIKPVQLKELNDSIISSPPSSQPTHFRRGQQIHIVTDRSFADSGSIAATAVVDDGAVDGANTDVEMAKTKTPTTTPQQQQQQQTLDPYDYAEPFDLLSNMPPSVLGPNSTLEDSKWKERKNALDELHSLLLRNPRLCPSPSYSSLVGALIKRIHLDANVSVVTLSSSCLSLLMSGLRSSYAPFRQESVPILLERMKERNKGVIESLRNSLDNLFYSFITNSNNGNIDLHLESALNYQNLSHKNPQVRSEHISWIARLIERNSQLPPNCLTKALKAQLKALLEKVFVLGCEDSSPEVRESSILLLSAILNTSFSSATISTFLGDRIDKGKLGKLLEKAANVSVAAKPSVSNQPSVSKQTSIPNTVTAVSTTAPSTPKKQQQKQPQANIEDLLKPMRSSNEEAMDIVADKLNITPTTSLSEAFKGAGGGAWKARVEFIDGLERLGLPSEDMFRCIIGMDLFKDGNVIVVSRGIQALITAASFSGSCPLLLFSLVCPLVLEKFSDPKLLPPAQKLFVSLIEQNQRCVEILLTCLNESFTCMKWSKSPKSLVDVMSFISSTSNAGADLRITTLLEEGKFIMTSLSHPQFTVRNAALRVIATFADDLSSVQHLLPSTLPPPLLKSLEDEFSKKVIGHAVGASVDGNNSMDCTSTTTVSATTSSAATVCAAITDIDVGAMDISSSLPSLLAMMSEPNWKARKEALESLHLFLKKPFIIASPSLLHDLMIALKGRLSDSNKILVTLTLEIVDDLAKNIQSNPSSSSSSSNAAAIFKPLLGSLVGTLSDAKTQVRQAALAALASINAGAGGSLKSVFTSGIANTIISTIPNSESPHLRKELMGFIRSLLVDSAAVVGAMITEEERNSLFSTILLCLGDRSSEVRKVAHLVVEGVLRCFSGGNQFLKYTEMNRPDLISTVKSIEITDIITPLSSASGKIVEKVQERPSKVFSGVVGVNGDGDGDNDNDGVWNSDGAIDRNIQSLKDSHLLLSSFKEVVFSPNPLSALNDLLLELKGEFDQRFLVHSIIIFKVLSITIISYSGASGSVRIRIVDCLLAILSLLDEQNGRLEEQEAAIILDSWIKSSSSLKQRKREPLVYRQFCRVYPASKIFSMIISLLQTADAIKNPASIRSANDELMALLTRNGLMVLQPSKHIPMLSQMSTLASYNLLLKISSLMGPSVMEGVSKPMMMEVDGKDEADAGSSAVIEDDDDAEEDDPLFDSNRVKRERPDVPQVFSLGPIGSGSGGDGFINPASLKPLSPQEFVNVEFHSTSDSQKRCPTTMIGKVIDDISHCNDRECLLALQRLDEVMDSADSSNPSNLNGLIFSLCIRLRECCTLRKEICFSNGRNGPLDGEVMSLRGRLCRYVVNALLALTTKHAALMTDLKTISMVIGEILSLVSQDNSNTTTSEVEDPSFGLHLFGLGECESLERNCNVLLVKFIENVPRSLCFLALINLLENSLKHSSPRFAEFVMKCLWKLTKQISPEMNPLKDQFSILRGIDLFLVRLPPVEWKKRAMKKEALEDLPLRTVKTIVNELSKIYGSSLLSDDSLDSDGYVYKYIKSLIPSNSVDADAETESFKVEEMSLEDLKSSLKDVCAKICTRPNTREGLLELFNLRRDQPRWAGEIEEYLLSLGTFFHRYIHRNLDQIQISSANTENNANEKYRTRLAQIQIQMSSGLKINDHHPSSGLVSGASGDTAVADGVTNNLEQGQHSPIRTRLESSDKKTMMGGASGSNSNASDSTILGLKERLARLREGGKSKLSN